MKVLKQEDTGNVRESIKKTKKGVHFFYNLCGMCYYFINKGIINSMSVHSLNLNFCSSEISGPFSAKELPFEKSYGRA